MTRNPNKALLVGLVMVEVVSAVYAWRDLGRRSDAQVRGPRNAWASVHLDQPWQLTRVLGHRSALTRARQQNLYQRLDDAPRVDRCPQADPL